MKFLGNKDIYLALEKKMILSMLDRTNMNVAKAARLFDVDRKTMYNKMRTHHIVMSRHIDKTQKN